MNGYFGEYGAEIKSIADFLGIDLGIVVTLNLSYELRRVSIRYALYISTQESHMLTENLFETCQQQHQISSY